MNMGAFSFFNAGDFANAHKLGFTDFISSNLICEQRSA
jgi:hypothetical protein